MNWTMYAWLYAWWGGMKKGQKPVGYCKQLILIELSVACHPIHSQLPTTNEVQTHHWTR